MCSATRESSGKGQIDKLELLVDELVKDKPDESRIRDYMEAAGLRYCADPIERMDRVFSALRVETAVPADNFLAPGGRSRERVRREVLK